jgi:hypothetical protein
MRNPLLWIIVPGLAVILAACVINNGSGAASMYVNREVGVGVSAEVSAAVAPASAPSAPLKGK